VYLCPAQADTSATAWPRDSMISRRETERWRIAGLIGEQDHAADPRGGQAAAERTHQL